MRKRTLTSLILAVCILVGSSCAAFAQDAPAMAETVAAAQKRTAEYLKNTVTDPEFGSVGGEWTVFALARAGYGDEAYMDRYYNKLAAYVKSVDGVLSTRKYTEYARAVLALSAIDRDVRNVEGYDLLAPLTDFENVTKQGVNGAVFALLAWDFYGDWVAVDDGEVEAVGRIAYLANICEQQHEDGGFGLGEESDPDITAMALCALANYKRLDYELGRKIDRAVAYLSSVQQDDGGFVSDGIANAESAAQVVTGLCALGIDPCSDARFQKNGNNPVTALLTYQNEDGSFVHKKGGERDLMATEQSMLALTAYTRFAEGREGLYRRLEVGDFIDTRNHWAKDSIKTMVSKGVMESLFGLYFFPDEDMLRGEFTKALVTLVAGADVEQVGPASPYEDVKAEDDFCKHVIYAAENGLIFGTDDTHFSPYQDVTRAQTATILYRYFQQKFGEIDPAEIEMSAVEGFADYPDCPEWSREALAYCVKAGLFIGSENQIFPNDYITHAEMSVILQRVMNQLEKR